LAYGDKGERGNPNMKSYFDYYKWTDEVMIAEIESLLEENSRSTYKIAIGHHPIGHLCAQQHALPQIEPLLKKYGFQSYFCGHSNGLGYSSRNGISYYRSGAGGHYYESKAGSH